MTYKRNSRQKILLVDDNKQNIEMLMELFKEDYKISAAVTSERALKIARAESPPDIILLDILMPDMDGYQICEILKNDEETKHIPIIFVTAVSEVMDETKGFAVGALDYITKPFHPPTVKARVEIQLNLKRKQDLLEKFAFIDALTEIPNRRRFDEVLEKEWNRSMRSEKPIALLIMDVDNFKQYNDNYGHGKGDVVLRRVASAIKGTLQRAGDFVARYGGEEFAAVLPYCDLDRAMDTAEQIIREVDDLDIAHAYSPIASHLTLSIGVSVTGGDPGTTPQTLIDAADKTLYEAKAEGKHRAKGMAV
ncbi:GGDEF domain-containing response regulator [Desulfobacter sp.]|uniref:GGDEF domain-containing response regulator n=1 Tax=Desulfobacter sp. TaxID=2294 RepID=UPI003D0D183D